MGGYNLAIPGGGGSTSALSAALSGTILNGLAATSSTLNIERIGTNMTYGGVFGNGAGTLTANMAGTGLLTLNGASPSPGPFVISSGTVLLNGSLAGPIADNSVLSFNNAGAQSLAVPVSGSGTVVKNGHGPDSLRQSIQFGGIGGQRRHGLRQLNLFGRHLTVCAARCPVPARSVRASL